MARAKCIGIRETLTTLLPKLVFDSISGSTEARSQQNQDLIGWFGSPFAKFAERNMDTLAENNLDDDPEFNEGWDEGRMSRQVND